MTKAAANARNAKGNSAALTERLATEWAELLAVLANPARLRMIEVMLNDEMTVGALSAAAALAQSAASQHLARMRNAGVVSIRGDAQFRYYTVVEQKRELVVAVMKVAASHVTSEKAKARSKWRLARSRQERS